MPIVASPNAEDIMMATTELLGRVQEQLHLITQYLQYLGQTHGTRPQDLITYLNSSGELMASVTATMKQLRGETNQHIIHCYVDEISGKLETVETNYAEFIELHQLHS